MTAVGKMKLRETIDKKMSLLSRVGTLLSSLFIITQS